MDYDFLAPNAGVKGRHVMGGKKRNADAPGKATINCSLNSLLATVKAIFSLSTLGRNDTSAIPMSDLFRNGIP
jgi:hypothetical protein